MDRRLVLLGLIVLAIVAGVYFLNSGQQGDYSKVLVIHMTVKDGSVTTRSVDIRYGHPPETGLRSGTFLGELVAADGNVVRTFTVWDPRIQLGDAVVDDGNGSIRSFMTRSSSSDLHLVLPYTGQEAGFRLSDRASGRILAAANLSDAAAAFSKTYPADPSRPAGNAGQFRLPQDAQALVAGVGIVLFLLLAVVFLLMIRGKKKS
jgi:hypothetical protein